MGMHYSYILKIELDQLWGTAYVYALPKNCFCLLALLIENLDFFFHYFIFLFFVFPDKLPNGVTYHTGTYQDRLTKLQDNLRQLSVLFRKLRLVYDKCNENCGGMDPIPVEVIFCDRGRMNIRCELVSRQLLLFFLSLLF